MQHQLVWKPLALFSTVVATTSLTWALLATLLWTLLVMQPLTGRSLEVPQKGHKSSMAIPLNILQPSMSLLENARQPFTRDLLGDVVYKSAVAS